MSRRFNPPPGWPSPPPGWTPSPGWRPDPSWPAPPEGWSFWIDERSATLHDKPGRDVRAEAQEVHDRSSSRSSQQRHAKRSYRIPILYALLRDGRWSRSDTLTAIGLVIAVAALVIPIAIGNLPASAPSPNLPSSAAAPNPPSSAPSPNLQVDKVEIAQANNIDATVQNPVGPASKVKSIGSAIDITLRNRGAAPALIVGATLSFTHSVELVNCTGAGPGLVTAQYDIKVPAGKVVTASDPLVLRRDMRFVIKPNSIDRFTISVGPGKYAAADWPWVYEFDLSLTQDNGQRLDLGPMSILGLPGASWNKFRGLPPSILAIGQVRSCVTRDASELSQAMAAPGRHSPELRTLYNEAKTLMAKS
jgi:hypothetical protein